MRRVHFFIMKMYSPISRVMKTGEFNSIWFSCFLFSFIYYFFYHVAFVSYYRSCNIKHKPTYNGIVPFENNFLSYFFWVYVVYMKYHIWTEQKRKNSINNRNQNTIFSTFISITNHLFISALVLRYIHIIEAIIKFMLCCLRLLHISFAWKREEKDYDLMVDLLIYTMYWIEISKDNQIKSMLKAAHI